MVGRSFARLQKVEMGCAAVCAAELLPPQKSFFRLRTTKDNSWDQQRFDKRCHVRGARHDHFPRVYSEFVVRFFLLKDCGDFTRANC